MCAGRKRRVDEGSGRVSFATGTVAPGERFPIGLEGGIDDPYSGQW